MRPLISVVLFVTAVAGAIKDPELGLDPPGIIKYYGYPFEMHEPVTEDGYVLALHRIPNRNKSAPVIYLQHGLLTSSADFMSNLPERSLAFVLADEGFDVWMGNSRGNLYSMKHKSMSSDDLDFWKFSWQEMALYDVPTCIDYILRATNRSSIYYVGHSQGTLTMFTAASLNNTIAKKVKHFFALAPIITERNIRGRIVPFMHRISKLLLAIARYFGFRQILADSSLPMFICGGNRHLRPICDLFTFDINGPSKQLNRSRSMVYNSHYPAGTSVDNIVHWGQMIDGPTRLFDHGNAYDNWLAYGEALPPLIDYSKFNVPSTLYYSKTDHLADYKDVQHLLKTIPTSSIHKARNLGRYNHVDFLQGIHAKKEIYEDIIRDIRKMESGKH